MRKMIIFAALLLIVSGCFNDTGKGTTWRTSNSPSNSNGPTQEDSASGDTGGISTKEAYVVDQYREIGRVLSVNISGVFVLSPKGFMYSLQWSGGVLCDFNLYYTDTECSGKVYFATSLLCNSYNSKTVYHSYRNNKLYIAKYVNDDGTAYYNNTKITFNSHCDCEKVYNFQYKDFYGIELIETTREIVGIPEAIIPPLSIVYK